MVAGQPSDFALFPASHQIFAPLLAKLRKVVARGKRRGQQGQHPRLAGILRYVAVREVIAVLIDTWMTRHVHAVKPLDSILHAREVMAQFRINQLPVVVDGQLLGIITDRDLRDAFPSVFEAMRGSGKGKKSEPKDIPVESVMTSQVVTLTPKHTVVEAARLMRQERVGAIPIVEGNRLIGMLTRSDVLDAFMALNEPEAPTADPAPSKKRQEGEHRRRHPHG